MLLSSPSTSSLLSPLSPLCFTPMRACGCHRCALLLLVPFLLHHTLSLVRLRPSIFSSSRQPWGTVAEVGDHSAWVTDLHRELSNVLPVIGEALPEPDLAWVCDRLAASLLPRLEEALGRCRRPTEAGLQQMLLDVQAVRGALLEVPEMAGKDLGQGYARVVAREASRVEAVLKVALGPGDSLAETFLSLVPGGTGAELLRVMALRGLRGAEAAEVKAEFERRSGRTVEESAKKVDVGAALLQRFQAASNKWGAKGGAGSAKDTWRKFFSGVGG